jgi:cytochrome d ubiquinol oxidase subunit II
MIETVWFVLVAAMLAAYAALDGFDLGAGALHLWAARAEQERRSVLAAIGPVWDGNEVWLVAAGGTLFYAFPLLYASSFSGFYLPLNMVVWLLLFRAIGIEFRAHLEDRLWRDFFDAAFSLASILLILFFGAALGNVLRGVPLGTDLYFFLPLWTTFQPGPNPGILDWYTVLCALVALAALSVHGALFIAMKTEDALQARMQVAVRRLWLPLVGLSAAALFATISLRPQLLDNYRSYPAGWAIPLLAAAGAGGILHFTRKGRERNAFLSSCLFLAAVLGGAAYGLYPALLPSSGDPSHAITIYNASAGGRSLSAGLYWWGAGMVVAVGYFVLVYTLHRGKVQAGNGHG